MVRRSAPPWRLISAAGRHYVSPCLCWRFTSKYRWWRVFCLEPATQQQLKQHQPPAYYHRSPLLDCHIRTLPLDSYNHRYSIKGKGYHHEVILRFQRHLTSPTTQIITSQQYYNLNDVLASAATPAPQQQGFHRTKMKILLTLPLTRKKKTTNAVYKNYTNKYKRKIRIGTIKHFPSCWMLLV